MQVAKARRCLRGPYCQQTIKFLVPGQSTNLRVLVIIYSVCTTIPFAKKIFFGTKLGGVGLLRKNSCNCFWKTFQHGWNREMNVGWGMLHYLGDYELLRSVRGATTACLGSRQRSFVFERQNPVEFSQQRDQMVLRATGARSAIAANRQSSRPVLNPSEGYFEQCCVALAALHCRVRPVFTGFDCRHLHLQLAHLAGRNDACSVAPSKI